MNEDSPKLLSYLDSKSELETICSDNFFSSKDSINTTSQPSTGKLIRS